MLGFETLSETSWPVYDPEKIIEETITIAVQFNGKTRGNISILKDQNQTEVESIIQNDSKLNKYSKYCIAKFHPRVWKP